MANLSLFVPVIFLALFVQHGNSVRCYVCSSDLNPICNDPFPVGGKDNITSLKLVNCDIQDGYIYPYLRTTKTVCKTVKKSINGQLVTSRGCAWKLVDDYNYSTCPNSTDGINVVTTFCETCEIDGCNGAATTE